MKLYRIDYTCLLLLILLSVCVLTSWFYRGNLFIGAEEGIIFQRIDIVYEKMVSSVWLDLYLGVPYFSDLSKKPFYAGLVFLFKQNIPAFFLQTFTIGIILLGSVVSCYLLFRETFKQIPYNRLAAFSGALFYLSNPYAISQIWGRGLYPQFFAYLYYPVVLLCIVYYFNSKRKFFLILNLFFSFILSAAMGNPSYFVSLWVLISVFWILRLVEFGWFSKKFFIQLTIGILFFISWLILNSWWLVVTLLYAPAAFLGEGTIFENSLTSLRAISSQYDYTSLLRLYHPLHFESQLYHGIYLNIFFQILSWSSFVIILFVIKYLKKKEIWFYICLFIIGFFVCLGSNPPFGIFFEWLFVKIPPLQVFRNPYEKFGLVYLLAYSGLFGVGIASIFNLMRRLNYLTTVFSVFIILLLTVFVFNWPLWTGDVISWGNQTVIPHTYKKIDDWQEIYNVSQERILFTPFLSSYGASYKWFGADYHGNDPLYQLIDASVITQTGVNPYLSAIKQYMGTKDLLPALDRIKVGFIVDRPDINSTAADRNSFGFLTKYYMKPTASYIQICAKFVYKSDHFSCQVNPAYQDFSQFQILKLVINANAPGYLEIAISDKNNVQPRWRGDKSPELNYQQNEINQDKTFAIYLFNPTENPNTDFNAIREIDIYFRNKDSKDTNFQVKEIYALKGAKTFITDAEYKTSIDKHRIFKLNNNDSLLTVKAYSTSKYVDTYDQLFDEFSKSNNTAFIINSQNDLKNILPDQSYETEINSIALDNNISLVNLKKKGTYLLVLSQNFNQEWKVIKTDSLPNLEKSYIEKIKWYFQSKVPESNHYTIDGFANGWIITVEQPSNIVIFYQPQILMELLWPISWGSFIILTGILLLIIFKSRK